VCTHQDGITGWILHVPRRFNWTNVQCWHHSCRRHKIGKFSIHLSLSVPYKGSRSVFSILPQMAHLTCFTFLNLMFISKYFYTIMKLFLKVAAAAITIIKQFLDFHNVGHSGSAYSTHIFPRKNVLIHLHEVPFFLCWLWQNIHNKEGLLHGMTIQRSSKW
jgi:hypothetical protein